MIETHVINDLLVKCNIEVSVINSLLLNSKDKAKNKDYLKHLNCINKIIQSLQYYKNLEPLEKAK
jgi:hypothetical protein